MRARLRLSWSYLEALGRDVRMALSSIYRPEERLRRAWLALFGYTERPIEDYRGLFRRDHRWPRRRKTFESHRGWRP